MGNFMEHILPAWSDVKPHAPRLRDAISKTIRLHTSPNDVDSDIDVALLTRTTGEHIKLSLGRSREEEGRGALDLAIEAPVDPTTKIVIPWNDYTSPKYRGPTCIQVLSLTSDWGESVVRQLPNELQCLALQYVFAKRYTYIMQEVRRRMRDDSAQSFSSLHDRGMSLLDTHYPRTMERWLKAQGANGASRPSVRKRQ